MRPRITEESGRAHTECGWTFSSLWSRSGRHRSLQARQGMVSAQQQVHIRRGVRLFLAPFWLSSSRGWADRDGVFAGGEPFRPAIRLADDPG